jgi:hypothetical protein
MVSGDFPHGKLPPKISRIPQVFHLLLQLPRGAERTGETRECRGWVRGLVLGINSSLTNYAYSYTIILVKNYFGQFLMLNKMVRTFEV